MIRRLSVLVILVLTGSGLAATPPDADSVAMRYADEVRSSDHYKRFLVKLEQVLDRDYLKRESSLDSAEGQAYLKSQIEADAAPAAASTDDALLSSGDQNGDDPRWAYENEFASTGNERRQRTTRPAASGSAFRESISSYDDVKAFVVARLYEDAAKLGKWSGLGTGTEEKVAGLHQVVLYHYLASRTSRPDDNLVDRMAKFFVRPGVKDLFGGFVSALRMRNQDEKKAALAMLDGYVAFRKASQKASTAATAVADAIDYCAGLAEGYRTGREKCATGTTQCTTLHVNLWTIQRMCVESLKTGGEQKAAASVHAWMADTILVLDGKNRSGGSQGPAAPEETGRLTAEQYTANVDKIEKFVDATRERQNRLIKLLKQYRATQDEGQREAMRKDILDLYAGTRSTAPLPVQVVGIVTNPHVVDTARSLPQNADQATRIRHLRVFRNETGKIAMMREQQETIDQVMKASGFSAVVDEAQSRAQATRDQALRRRKAGPGAPEGTSERESGESGFARGANNVMSGLSQMGGPLLDQVFRANEQADVAARRQKEMDAAIARQNFERQDALERQRSAQSIAEQQAAANDANAQAISDAQTRVDEMRERQRQADLEFDRREAEARQKAEQEQRAAQAANTQANAPVTNTSVAGPTTAGPTSVAGQGPGAPTNSVAIPGNSGTPAATAGTGSQAAAQPLLTDAQIQEIARSKVPTLPNSFGIEPPVLTDEEIRAAIDPAINAKVAEMNKELAAKGITVNADLQYSGPGITSTGGSGMDRHQMWLTRFPDMKNAAVQLAQNKYNTLLQQQVNTLAAARRAQQAQLAAQQNRGQQGQGPVSVAGSQGPAAPGNTAQTPAAPAATPVATPENPRVVSARKVISEFDQKAGGKSGIQPNDFIAALDRYNATNPVDLNVDLAGLVRLVKVGALRSAVNPPNVAADLGPDGQAAQAVIDEFDRRAGGKSGITPADFVDARNRVNATSPNKVEINLPGLVRLVEMGALRSNVKAPSLQDSDPRFVKARQVIEEFDRRAGGKSEIKPADFISALERYNATSPYDLELDLAGLTRLVQVGSLQSKVQPGKAEPTRQPSGTTVPETLELDDGRFGLDSGS